MYEPIVIVGYGCFLLGLLAVGMTIALTDDSTRNKVRKESNKRAMARGLAKYDDHGKVVYGNPDINFIINGVRQEDRDYQRD